MTVSTGWARSWLGSNEPSATCTLVVFHTLASAAEAHEPSAHVPAQWFIWLCEEPLNPELQSSVTKLRICAMLGRSPAAQCPPTPPTHASTHPNFWTAAEGAASNAASSVALIAQDSASTSALSAR